MLPPPHIFSAKVRRLGLGDGLRLVTYDQRGIFSAPRVWWTFRAFGHEEVAVLGGGLPSWMNEGRPVEAGEARPETRHFTPRSSEAPPVGKEGVSTGRSRWSPL